MQCLYFFLDLQLPTAVAFASGCRGRILLCCATDVTAIVVRHHLLLLSLLLLSSCLVLSLDLNNVSLRLSALPHVPSTQRVSASEVTNVIGRSEKEKDK